MLFINITPFVLLLKENPKEIIMKFTSSDFELIVNKSTLFDALTFVVSLDDPDMLELLENQLINDVATFFDEYIKMPRHQRSSLYFLQELLEIYDEMLDESDVPSHSSLQDAINKLNELGITPPNSSVILESLEQEMQKIVESALKNDKWFQQCIN